MFLINKKTIYQWFQQSNFRIVMNFNQIDLLAHSPHLVWPLALSTKQASLFFCNRQFPASPAVVGDCNRGLVFGWDPCGFETFMASLCRHLLVVSLPHLTRFHCHVSNYPNVVLPSQYPTTFIFSHSSVNQGAFYECAAGYTDQATHVLQFGLSPFDCILTLT